MQYLPPDERQHPPRPNDRLTAGGISWWVRPTANFGGLNLPTVGHPSLAKRVALEQLIYVQDGLAVRYCHHDPDGYVYFAVQQPDPDAPGGDPMTTNPTEGARAQLPLLSVLSDVEVTINGETMENDALNLFFEESDGRLQWVDINKYFLGVEDLPEAP